MKRYLRTLRLFWSTSIGVEMEYRTNFLMAPLASLGMLSGSLFGLSLFYQHGYTMGAWKWSEVLIVMGLYTTIDGLQATFLAPNRQRITEYVREGTLDFVLLKPMDSQFIVSIRDLSVWGIPNIILGLSLVLYSGNIELKLGWSNHLNALMPMALGVFILYSIGFMLGTLTIWFVKLWNVTIAMQSLLEAGRFPINAYSPGFRIFFTYVVPVVFLTTVPAEAMLGRMTTGWLLTSVILATGLFVAARIFWLIALRSYTSASS